MENHNGPYIVIIGGGLAAFAAAIELAELGAKVKLVKVSPGASGISSGSWDIADDLNRSSYDAWQDLKPISHNIFNLIKKNEFHPYAVLASGYQNNSFYQYVHQVVANASDQLPLRMMGVENQNKIFLTPMGTLKSTAWVQASQGGISISELKEAKLLIAGIRGYAPFQARFIRDALEIFLEKQADPPISFTGYLEMEMPGFEGRTNLSVPELAHYLDKEENFVKFGKAIVSYLEGKVYSHLLLPPILGVQNSRLIVEALNQITGLQCAESLALPVSIPGLRLENAINRYMNSHNIDIIEGKVVGFEHLSRRIKYLDVQLDDSVIKIPVKAVILATGKFIGNGIQHQQKFLEPIFHLPLFYKDQPVQALSPLRLAHAHPQAGQPFNSVGVRINAQTQPLSEDGDVAFENLFAAGAVIGGADFAFERCGAGVAIVTGQVAGKNAKSFL